MNDSLSCVELYDLCWLFPIFIKMQIHTGFPGLKGLYGLHGLKGQKGLQGPPGI